MRVFDTTLSGAASLVYATFLGGSNGVGADQGDVVTGIAVGAGTSFGVSTFLHWPSLLSPVAMVGSAVLSMMIGVFFGYYPAKKAAALDPIEALRFE